MLTKPSSTDPPTIPPSTYPPTYTPQKKDSKTFLFPTMELFQLARNADIKKKPTTTTTFMDTGKMCPIKDI